MTKFAVVITFECANPSKALSVRDQVEFFMGSDHYIDEGDATIEHATIEHVTLHKDMRPSLYPCPPFVDLTPVSTAASSQTPSAS